MQTVDVSSLANFPLRVHYILQTRCTSAVTWGFEGLTGEKGKSKRTTS
jgi:hypothetical protein